MENNQYTKGYFIELSLAIGIPVGLPIGLIIGNIILGLVLGLGLGLIIGIFLETKYNLNPRQLTIVEKKARNKKLWIVLSFGSILFCLIGILYYYFELQIHL